MNESQSHHQSHGMISRAKAERFLPGRLFVKLVHAIPPGDSRMGPLKKSRQRCSRHFSVLTYLTYVPRVKIAAALLDGLF
jgi:hypothetical protein